MLQTLKSAAGAALIAVLCVMLYWPRPARAPVAPAAPAAPAAPYCDEVAAPVAVATDAKPKATCSPACKATEVCIDGVCCQPAAAPHSPGSSNAVAFAADSLR